MFLSPAFVVDAAVDAVVVLFDVVLAITAAAFAGAIAVVGITVPVVLGHRCCCKWSPRRAGRGGDGGCVVIAVDDFVVVVVIAMMMVVAVTVDSPTACT